MVYPSQLQENIFTTVAVEKLDLNLTLATAEHISRYIYLVNIPCSARFQHFPKDVQS